MWVSNFFFMGSQSRFSVMNINLSALQSKQSGVAQRDAGVVQHQLLWCRRAVSTAQECCVTTSAILVTLHFQLMLISHGKGLFDQVRTSSSKDAVLGSDLFSLTTRLFVHSPAVIIRAHFRFIFLLDYRLLREMQRVDRFNCCCVWWLYFINLLQDFLWL